jgi:FkbM family methyltransferase
MPHALHHLARAVCQHFPFLSGRGTLVQLPPLRWLRFAEDRLAVRLANGPRLVVFPNDFIGKSVYFFGDVDPKVPRTLSFLLDPADTLIDVGANVGLVSLQCLPLLGPHGRAVAVEPQPLCCEAMAETIALNGITNLEVHRIALSDQAGQLTLSLPDASNLGTASLEPGPAGSHESRLVEVKNGSDFLESLRIEGEYAVKIDVEGHEGKVLAGLAPFFARRPPRGIVFESHGHKYEGEDFFSSPAYGLLSAAGFRIFQIHKSLVSLKYSEVRPGKGAPEATDFVAMRPDQVERLPEPRAPARRQRRPAATVSGGSQNGR